MEVQKFFEATDDGHISWSMQCTSDVKNNSKVKKCEFQILTQAAYEAVNNEWK
jgi:hypothetical protein